jgi:hypothetical protein
MSSSRYLQLVIATALLYFRMNFSWAGYFSACDPKNCIGAQKCEHEIRWSTLALSAADLTFIWSETGEFRYIRIQATLPYDKEGNISKEDAVAKISKILESGINLGTTDETFKDSILKIFDFDSKLAKQYRTVINNRLAGVCQKLQGRPIQQGVIIATSPADMAKQMELAGILRFCDVNSSASYMSAVSDATWLSMRSTVARFPDLNTQATRPDGHHFNKVVAYHDTDNVPGNIVVRLEIEPYTEYQFSDRSDLDFNSRNRSNCDIEDAATREILTRFGLIMIAVPPSQIRPSK